MNNLKIAIPLKTNSTRVENKNLRPFHGDNSLFDVKAKQLLDVFNPEDIYVSSENPLAKPIVEKYGFNFHLRDKHLTKNETAWCDVVRNIVDCIPNKSCDVLWCQVTQPMFNEFREIVDVYKTMGDEFDSLCVVQRMSHHLIDEHGNPINFNFGYWHKISQDLPKLYQVTWASFIMRRSLLNEVPYQIGKHPYLYNTDAPLVDIDTPKEFKMAQLIYDAWVNKRI